MKLQFNFPIFNLISIASLGLVLAIVAEVVNNVLGAHQLEFRLELRSEDIIHVTTTANESRALAGSNSGGVYGKLTLSQGNV